MVPVTVKVVRTSVQIITLRSQIVSTMDLLNVDRISVIVHDIVCGVFL